MAYDVSTPTQHSVRTRKLEYITANLPKSLMKSPVLNYIELEFRSFTTWPLKPESISNKFTCSHVMEINFLIAS
jgi:hypothetical protein